MKKFYRFSPIKDEKTLEQVFLYITRELEKLSEKIFKENLSIDTLKVFAHYPDEYDYLYNLISKMGPKSDYSSETSFYVEVDKKFRSHNINLLGLRIVDPYRMQVGCGDWSVEKFPEIKEKYLNSNPYVRDMKRATEMLEVWHPDFDILGYIVPTRPPGK